MVEVTPVAESPGACRVCNGVLGTMGCAHAIHRVRIAGRLVERNSRLNEEKVFSKLVLGCRGTKPEVT